jgi:colanic acid/amylovoran biosynthesis glycosyltransferase
MNSDVSLPKMGYLVSTYPAISHTFILREIQHLRRDGWQIVSASVNQPDRSFAQMDAYERQEAESTYGIKADGVRGALKAAWWGFSHHGLHSVKMMASSWRLGGATKPWKGIAYGVEALMVARWMAQQGVRHLHVHFGNAGATVGLLTKRLNQCHLSLTIHGPDEFDDVPGQHLALKMKEADAVICISQFARSQLMRISDSDHWHKLQVCRLGVDPTQFPFRTRAASDVVQMLCVGRLTPAKCQVLLVQACAQLRDAGLSFHLKMVGAGPDRARIEREVVLQDLQSHITMTGALNQQEVKQAFAQADVFVLPSLAEGIPVVLMEAMCSGVPCVTTPVNGIPELIEHGVSGLLATPGDVESLTAQLQRILSSCDLRQSLANAARDKVTTHFDLAKNVRQLGGLLQKFQQNA